MARWVEIAASRKWPEPPSWFKPMLGGKVSAEVRQKPLGRPPGGMSAAARDLGVPRQSLQRATKIAALSPEARAAACEAGLDGNQSALLKAAKEKSPDRRVAVTEREICA